MMAERMVIIMTIGQSIKRIRKSKGISQAAIAKALQISQGAVSQWENDITVPSSGQIAPLADLLGVNVDELFGRPVVISTTTPQPHMTLEPEELILVGNFRLLNASGQAAIMATIAGLLDNPAFRQDASTSSSNA